MKNIFAWLNDGHHVTIKKDGNKCAVSYSVHSGCPMGNGKDPVMPSWYRGQYVSMSKDELIEMIDNEYYCGPEDKETVIDRIRKL